MTDIDTKKPTMTTARSKQLAPRSSAAANWGTAGKLDNNRDKLQAMVDSRKINTTFQTSRTSGLNGSSSISSHQVTPMEYAQHSRLSAGSPPPLLRHRQTSSLVTAGSPDHSHGGRSVILDGRYERPKTTIGGHKMQAQQFVSSTIPTPVPVCLNSSAELSTSSSRDSDSVVLHPQQPPTAAPPSALRRAKSSMDILERELRAIRNHTPTRCRKDPPRGSLQFENLMYEFQKMEDAETAESCDTVHGALSPHHQRLSLAGRLDDSRIKRRLSWNPEISVLQIARISETD